MKNIHVLPTDKPSRLYLTTKEYISEKEYSLSTDECQNKHIYITSDEEIKDGDYGLVVNEILSYNKMIELWGVTQGWKIILTTDQDLIKDGVQEIDDDFLNWFIKNPSCEEVETKVEFLQTPDNLKDGFYYKIIIPKEEPKQETQSYICPKTKKQCDDECCVSAEDCHIEASFGIISDCITPKQETLEEVAEKLTNDFPALEVRFNMTNEEIHGWFLEALQKGAKWQQEQGKNKYSEEDMKEAFSMGRAGKTIKDFNKKFKNK